MKIPAVVSGSRQVRRAWRRTPLSNLVAGSDLFLVFGIAIVLSALCSALAICVFDRDTQTS